MAWTDTGVLTESVRALYNAAAVQAFVEEGVFARSAAVEVASMAERGKSAVFDVWPAVATSTAALGETDDGTPVSQTMTQVEVSLVEYGSFEKFSGKLRLIDYGSPERRAAWQMGSNAIDTLDLVARDQYDSETGATWNGYAGSGNTAITTLVITDKLTGTSVRQSHAELRTKKVRPVDGGYYLCYIHPHVYKDLKDETGDGSWQKKEQYAGNLAGPAIFGEVGEFEGFRFVQTTNCKIATKGGDGTTTTAASADVYTTYFVGAEAIGRAMPPGVPEIDVKVGMPTVGINDAFGRHSTLGWYALTGFAPLKDDSLFKFHSSSSMAANGS